MGLGVFSPSKLKVSPTQSSENVKGEAILSTENIRKLFGFRVSAPDPTEKLMALTTLRS